MILCCGEALIDMIPGHTAAGEDAWVPHCGGAVFNTAIALGRLGAGAGMLTGLSTDPFGRKLEAALTESGVSTAYCVRTSRPTTLAFVHLEEGQASYTFYDQDSALRGLRAGDLKPIGNEAACLYFGGISLCSPPAADVLVELAERHAERCAVMVDPNIRPGFITSPGAYRARLERLLRVTRIVKVSDDDLAWLFPGPEPVRDKIARLLEMGPELVVLTRGAEGASAFRPDGSEISAPAERARVKDTVGAGDTFNAGFLAKARALGLLAPGALRQASGEQLAACLRFGARVAAITVSRAGANPPWLHELKDAAET